jgi:hypothetical protein
MADPIYEAPAIAEIGSLHELTLTVKTFGASDGIIRTLRVCSRPRIDR